MEQVIVSHLKGSTLNPGLTSSLQEPDEEQSQEEDAPLYTFSATKVVMSLGHARPVERSEVDPAAPFRVEKVFGSFRCSSAILQKKSSSSRRQRDDLSHPSYRHAPVDASKTLLSP